jgi:hypothetical protein
MDRIEHLLQDAFEIYAVGVLQQLAEERGIAISSTSEQIFTAFQDYLSRRGHEVSRDLLSKKYAGMYDTWKRSLDDHLPAFLDRLCEKYPGESFDFVDVEKDARNMSRREDFEIRRTAGRPPILMSLKNYRKTALNPQLGSGTFNTFVLRLLFDSVPGVGYYHDPFTNERFSSRNYQSRDQAIRANGHDAFLPILHEFDQINSNAKAEFVYSPETLFFDAERWAAACQRDGSRGAALGLEALDQLGDEAVKAAFLKFAGLGRGDHMLLMDPKRCVDSLSSVRFQELQNAAHDAESIVHCSRPSEQTVLLTLVTAGGEDLLSIRVPFTLNSNGAWHRNGGVAYSGTQRVRDIRTDVDLRYLERRPFKSQSLNTSINTWVEFGKAGLFN